MTSITVNVLVEGSSQCDQIGRFLEVVLATNILTREAEIFGGFLLAILIKSLSK